MSQRKNFKDYLDELSQSFFCLSPNGNGIDCHKTWECMYLKTIPVVTKSINIDFYKEFPLLIIDNWDNFDVNLLTYELYNEINKKHEDNMLDFSFFKKLCLNK